MMLGTLTRAMAIRQPGMFLSHPGTVINESYLPHHAATTRSARGGWVAAESILPVASPHVLRAHTGRTCGGKLRKARFKITHAVQALGRLFRCARTTAHP